MATVYKKVELVAEDYPIELSFNDLKNCTTAGEKIELAKEGCWREPVEAIELGAIAIKALGVNAIQAMIEASQTIEEPPMELVDPDTESTILG